MKPFPFKILLSIALCGFLLLPPAKVFAETQETFVHFFVVPAVDASGTQNKAAVSDLKTYLLKTAGGYTILGASAGGWVSHQGAVEKDNNITFWVTAPRNFSTELKRYLKKNFKMQEPYVVVWKAE
ncbi:MAG TPA: hypothetical protein PKL97_02315 [Candidatus Omnitrophota bacterium]|nr:hypothetical protein [Candidatus Omnitrophota bacterium]